MNPTHFHLVMTHLPIYGLLIGIVILLIGLVRKNQTLKTTATLLFIAMAIVAIPVFLSGEEAEETIEHLIPDVKKSIHEHEERAEKAIWLMAVLGVSSLFSLYAAYKKPSISGTIHILSLIVAIATFAAYVNVGYLGGQIRHTEIRTMDKSIPSSDAILQHEEEDDD